jgi:glycosyltransferase involved in cell wall biosynthesis
MNVNSSAGLNDNRKRSVTDNSQIRIAYILWSGKIGGAERHVVDLALALPDNFSATVCFLTNQGEFGKILQQHGIPIAQMNLKSGWDIIGAMKFVHWVRASNFDLIHDHLSTPWSRFLIGSNVSRATPIIYTEHSQHILDGYNIWDKIWGRINAHFTNQFIAVSTPVKEALSREIHISLSKIEVIPNFVDTLRFKGFTREQRELTRKSIGIPQDAQVLITVGRLQPSKGTSDLIEFLRPLLLARKDLHMIIVGDGPKYEELKALVQKGSLYEQVHLLGARMDVPQLLNAADLFVYASQIETFGIAIIEAMAAGLPVVAMKIKGLQEIINEGETGILIPEINMVPDFSLSVNFLLDQPDSRASMGRAGQLRVSNLYSKERVVKRILEIYYKCIG